MNSSSKQPFTWHHLEMLSKAIFKWVAQHPDAPMAPHVKRHLVAQQDISLNLPKHDSTLLWSLNPRRIDGKVSHGLCIITYHPEIAAGAIADGLPDESVYQYSINLGDFSVFVSVDDICEALIGLYLPDDLIDECLQVLGRPHSTLPRKVVEKDPLEKLLAEVFGSQVTALIRQIELRGHELSREQLADIDLRLSKFVREDLVQGVLRPKPTTTTRGL